MSHPHTHTLVTLVTFFLSVKILIQSLSFCPSLSLSHSLSNTLSLCLSTCLSLPLSHPLPLYVYKPAFCHFVKWVKLDSRNCLEAVDESLSTSHPGRDFKTWSSSKWLIMAYYKTLWFFISKYFGNDDITETSKKSQMEISEILMTLYWYIPEKRKKEKLPPTVDKLHNVEYTIECTHKTWIIIYYPSFFKTKIMHFTPS